MKHKWVTIIMGVLAGSILFASIAFMVTTGSSAKAQLMHDGILTADSSGLCGSQAKGYQNPTR
jgi:hypothetical protein